MSVYIPPERRRTRFLILLVMPGLLIVAAAVITFLVKRSDPAFDFGKRRLLLVSLAGLVLSLAGFVLHRKALADYLMLRRAYWKTLLFSTVCVVVGPVLTVLLLDRTAGLSFRLVSPPPIFVLRPHTSESYRTSEFSFTATTNAAGLRGREVDLRRKNGTRVLVLGDSFTYGWGVNDEEAWPAVVERTLTESGRPVEVLNCGCPGAGVDAYAEVAERLIPVAKPDVVLVAVLQGIDLKLADIGTTTDRLYQFKLEASRRAAPPLLAATVPNLCELPGRLALARTPAVSSAADNRKRWQAEAEWMTGRLAPDEAERFKQFDPTTREMFTGGDINPWEVYFAIKYPDYVGFTLYPTRTGAAVATMAGHLARIRDASARSGAKVAVLSVPPAWYFSVEACDAKRRVGYHLPDSALRSPAPDAAIQSACQASGLEFYSLNFRFLDIAKEEKWYFPFDGMYNSRGHAIFAAEAAKVLPQLLE